MAGDLSDVFRSARLSGMLAVVLFSFFLIRLVCALQDCVPRQRIKKVANLRNQGKKEAACCGNTLRNDWAPGKNLNSDRKGKKGREIQALSCSVLQPVNTEVSIS